MRSCTPFGTTRASLCDCCQRKDDTGARRFLSSVPTAKHMIADYGYDADGLITTVMKQGVIFYLKQ